MSRAEMVEKLAENLYLELMVETRDEWPLFEFLPEAAKRNWRNRGSKILGTILPQVTTIEELGCCNRNAILVSESGIHAEASSWWASMFRGPSPFPLTVVWQP